MGKRTAMLLPPTLEECVALAKDPEIKLDEREARKFWAHYESNGWKVGKVPMVSLRGAMVGWKLRYEEKLYLQDNNPQRLSGNGEGGEHLSGIDKTILSGEMERILIRMNRIRASYSENQSWSREDFATYKKLKGRLDEIRKKLGVMW